MWGSWHEKQCTEVETSKSSFFSGRTSTFAIFGGDSIWSNGQSTKLSVGLGVMHMSIARGCPDF